ncbi:hypothetical protein, partial [uncultured Porphyromonas sp.]|uniref:hypothetical protein n=1 Tax=uncultured Porphyromonas sp. TaxID=159274 RepID=UPI00262EBC7C
RERRDALAESAETLLPRALRRSYRERRDAHTESAETLLPRAQRRSYRERRDAHTAGLMHEITMVRGQGREGVYTEDRSIYVLV